MKKTFLLILAGVILVGGTAFYSGTKYAESKSPRGAMRGNFQQFGANGLNSARMAGGNRADSGFTAGEIIAKDDKSVTVKMPSGGSKIIFYSDTAEIGKFTSGSSADLEIGKNISVSGTANQDGSVTAISIQIRPANFKADN